MTMPQFVPDNVVVPAMLETADFRIRMLCIHDLVKDYDAVMSSVEHLQGVFGPDDDWPVGLTLEEDLVDLGWHQKEFELKRSFAFTVMSLDESRCLGCVYIDPTEKRDVEASVILWVRQSELENGLDQILYETVQQWVTEKWWFKRVGYPGRDISWNDWDQLETWSAT